MTNPIGVFDSGIGGLTVVKELIKCMPTQPIVYFGDTARVPYGGKSVETIQKFAAQIVNFLLSKDVKLIVVACNTVSATALDWLKSRYSIPIIGVIEAGARKAVNSTINNKVGVIGTRATIASRAYTTAIHKLHPGIKVYSKSCPLLVPLVEEGSDSTLIKLVLTRYLLSLKKKNIDTLILGCTHYPLIRNDIQSVIGEQVKLIDSASTVAHEVKNIIKYTKAQPSEVCQELTSVPPITPIANNQFYFSDIQRGFNQLSKRFMGYHIQYTKISLE